ncbi:hypothetical protein [Acinetobacter kanungonis]|uniref:hypothetical protein n=1 Tax=Acinetobacter kanungonis TaxID=2699469 RepID=UPI001379743C|nr:hypothetical protein [Acinetobacter kanungonis]NCI77309.1 hypothetical protein [Acinetobacter kanungonis]
MQENFNYEEFESYIKNFGERGSFLAWFKYCVVELAPQQKNDYLVSLNNGLFITMPSKQVIKEDLLKTVKNSIEPLTYLELFNLYIKNMIIPDDQLTFIGKTDIRLIHWLLFDLKILKNNFISTQVSLPINNIEDYSNLIDFLLKRAYLYPELSPKMGLSNNSITPNVLIEWKRNDPSIIFRKDDFYNQLITEYDLLEVDFNTKLTELHKSMYNFNILKTQDEEIEWLIANDEGQISWAINYFKKIKMNITILDNFENINPYDQLVLMFDNISRSPTLDRTTFITKMKKSWAQQKFRSAGKTKKNYHLPLTNDCKEKLSKLSALFNMSENKLLEKLINDKYQAEAVDKNGKFKY